ncbi:thioredoxin domain-containing protein [Pseudomonas sp. MWU12-2037]|uniref:thioredoxin domain-containing protein n=1 Tax=Pseudomonas sp. MWU12-2037 TaxID=2928690 RepID=UPI00200ECFE8|nr:thioredoxin domain-containing protein [Pseudomonas sp. MWU12-2037]
MKGTNTVIEIKTRQAFRAELGSLEVPLIRPRPAVVLVYKRHCPPCEKLKPLLEALASGPYRDRVAFYQISYPIFKLFQPEIKIEFVPALFFLDGHGNQTHMYGTQKDEVKKGLDSLIFVPNGVFSEIFDSRQAH